MTMRIKIYILFLIGTIISCNKNEDNLIEKIDKLERSKSRLIFTNFSE